MNVVFVYIVLWLHKVYGIGKFINSTQWMMNNKHRGRMWTLGGGGGGGADTSFNSSEFEFMFLLKMSRTKDLSLLIRFTMTTDGKYKTS